MYKPIEHSKLVLCENIYGPSIAKRAQALASSYAWFNLAEDGFIELTLDNHMMQSFRGCEAYFVESFLGRYGSSSPVWFLHLGTAVHKMMEIYYTYRKHPMFSLDRWILGCGKKIWYALNMDQFSKVPEYEVLGGLVGFGGLLIQYATYYNHDNERFRVVGTELYFGKGREVPLFNGSDWRSLSPYPFRLYLAGKIDLLVDDGESICPIDHKTSKNFMGKNPQLNYEINDGLTGYVYAARKLVQQFNLLSPEQKLNRKPSNKIWMNYLQIALPPKDKTNADRFKRMPLYKTDQQLEDYRLRQIQTGRTILNLLLNPEILPSYNTMMCSNWMHRDCPFKQVHRLDTTSAGIILNSAFVRHEWKPEEPTETDRLIGDIYDIFESN